MDVTTSGMFVNGVVAANASAAFSAGLIAEGGELYGLDPVAVDAGRLAGRVETLLWAQAELQLELDNLRTTDRFADTRQLETFLARVQDSLRSVQDGTGTWAGLVRSVVEATDLGGTALEAVPGPEMGG